MSRWRWLVGIAVAGAVAVATWTPPEEMPSSAPIADRQSDVAAAGPEVAAPWQPGRPELGIHVYWEDNPVDDEAALRFKARRLLDHIVGMEANSVAFSFPFYVDSINATSVRADPRTPSPERFAILLDEARRAGLRTSLRPLMDQNNLQVAGEASWRGQFMPANRVQWFAAYGAFLDPYLEMAEKAGVSTVALGAELNRLQSDPGWRRLAASARTRFSGQLAYSANWDAYPTAVGLPVDIVNIDAYPTLPLGPESTEEEMTAAWQDYLDRTAAGNVTGLVLAEVGGPAERELVTNPALYHTPGAALDEDIQRRWFAAACTAGRDRGIAGFYWWKLDLHDDPAAADPDRDRHDTFVGRPSEGAIRACFTAWGAVV